MTAPLPFLALLILALTGCGDGVEACEAYNTAIEACYDNLGMDSEFTVDCEGAPTEMTDSYNCLADLYNNSECTITDMPSQAEAEAC